MLVMGADDDADDRENFLFSNRDTVLLALPCSPTVGRSDDVEDAAQSSLQPVSGIRRHLL